MAQLLTVVSSHLPVSVYTTDTSKGIFRKMLPLGSKYQLRLISVNMRGYRGSTAYNVTEIEEISSPNIEVQAAAVRKFGREIAQFLVYVCTKLGISPIRTDGEGLSAGLVLLTWSMSNLAITTILGDRNTLEVQQRHTLSRFLRKAIIYGMRYPLCDEVVGSLT